MIQPSDHAKSREVLASGMYVNVLLSLTKKREALIIPQSAIFHSSYGNSVYLFKLIRWIYLRAKQVTVTLGERKGDYEVVSGVTEGSAVITDGVFKIYPGAALLLEDARAPTSELSHFKRGLIISMQKTNAFTDLFISDRF